MVCFCTFTSILSIAGHGTVVFLKCGIGTFAKGKGLNTSFTTGDL